MSAEQLAHPAPTPPVPPRPAAGERTSSRGLGVLLAVGGAVGLLAAFVLAVERFRLATDPSYVPSCSLNPVLSCGSVMTTEQASLLGFPNPLLGIAAFTVATTLGVLLVSGVVLPRWVALGLQAGLGAGLVLVAWLIWQSLYVIGALCPYCTVVWVVVIAMFWAVTADNLERGALPVPARARPAVEAVADYRVLLVVATCAVVLVLAGVEFWAYWRTLLT